MKECDTTSEISVSPSKDTQKCSHYHCKCNDIPEIYLTPLQRKNLLLKDYKTKIKTLEQDKLIQIKKNNELQNEISKLNTKLEGLIDPMNLEWIFKAYCHAPILPHRSGGK